jgi:hypothetical protein
MWTCQADASVRKVSRRNRANRRDTAEVDRGRLVCHPVEENGEIGYTFTATGTYRRLGVPLAESFNVGGDPGGIRTRDLDLERVASWARLDDGVNDRSPVYLS